MISTYALYGQQCHGSPRRLAATRGDNADVDSRGPGSLRVALLDGLHSLSTGQWSDADLDAINISEDRP